MLKRSRCLSLRGRLARAIPNHERIAMGKDKGTSRLCRGLLLLSALLAASILSSCSINRLSVQILADALTGVGSSTAITGDDDPELIGDALPLMLKVYEILLEQLPAHEGLNLQAGSLAVMYGNAFVQTPAELLPADQADLKRREIERARKLYARGERVLSAELERKFPGLMAALAADKADSLLAKAKKPDAAFLYWEGASIMAGFALDPYNVALSTRIKEVKALMARAYELDPGFGGGSIDDFYISFYGSLPPYMGGDRALAKKHFELALQKGGGKVAGPYLSWATATALPDQDWPEFKRLMEAALAVDASKYPETRLVNTIAQRRAAWYLARKDDLFIDTGSESIGTDAGTP
jgi:predicted anti-sigma-YlaC factor YlaD